MIMATIQQGRESELQTLLASMNSALGFADPANPLVPFAHFSRLHVARFVIMRANTNDDIIPYGIQPQEWTPKLAFLGDIDGDLDSFLGELVVRAGIGLDKIFSHCETYDADRFHSERPSVSTSYLLKWLQDNNQAPTANYQNWRGRTVNQIHQEQALTQALESHLSEYPMGELVHSGLRLIHQQLRDFVKQQTDSLGLHLDPPVATPAGWWLKNLGHLIALPLILLLAAPLGLIFAPVYFWYLRRLERADPENTQRADPEHLLTLIDQEDIDVTNHFNVFGQVKPGVFRGLTMRALLAVLNYASRHVYNRGFLARIQTIHFARWVLLDNNKRVYFASNYDGSADSYMDDFINKVAWGLNLVFSNGVGYPTTRWLIKQGAENEGKYKKTLRRSQLPSASWYKAYPGLTAVDLARHSRIREVLVKKNPTNKELKEWIGLLKYRPLNNGTLSATADLQQTRISVGGGT